MRVFLLRCLIGWWVTIMTWFVMWPIAYLLFGGKTATEMSIEIVKAVWYGDQ